MFKPGQYAILSIDKPSSTNNDIPHRALSIASHPDENLLRFSIRKSESGFKQSCDLMKLSLFRLSATIEAIQIDTSVYKH